MQNKLESGKYTTVEAFISDVRLIIANCEAYNPSDSVYAKAAKKLGRYFEQNLLKDLKEST